MANSILRWQGARSLGRTILVLVGARMAVQIVLLLVFGAVAAVFSADTASRWIGVIPTWLDVLSGIAVIALCLWIAIRSSRQKKLSRRYLALAILGGASLALMVAGSALGVYVR